MAENLEFVNIDILMLGKTGHGKSATANSILGRKVFESVGNMESVTTSVDFDVCKLDNKIIMVVDVPGVCDTDENKDLGLTNMLKTAVAAHPQGYHALLLVYKYGCRFTLEEEHAVSFLKKNLGNAFIKNHAILVFTNGDTFENEGKRMEDFISWCQEQTGNFDQLLKECDYRAVLFNNHSKDSSRLQAQRRSLLDMIDSRLSGKRYSHEMFTSAQSIQDKIIKGGGLLTEDMLVRSSLILQDAERMSLDPEMFGNSIISRMRVDIRSLSKEIRERRSVAMHDVLNFINGMENIISEENDQRKSRKGELSRSKLESVAALVNNLDPSKCKAFVKTEPTDSYKKMKRTYLDLISKVRESQV